MFDLSGMNVVELHTWYEDLAIREQQIRNTKELIKRELNNRVKS